MKSTSVVSDGLVHQVLSKDNYERWKIVMQNYLEGQGLWDVVVKNADDDCTDHTSKRMKDAKALYFFQLSSCARELLETIKKSSRNHLTNTNNTDSKPTPDLEQGLWDIIKSVSEYETKEASRKTKDARALHAIQMSCGREIVDEISHYKTAKEAWNRLGSLYGKDLTAGADILQAVLLMDDSLPWQYKEMFGKIERGEFIGNIGMDFNLYMTSASSRSTLLHVAVIVGNVENVKKLVKEGKATLVCMQDQHGDTALSLVARYTGNKDIAKCLVEEINEKSQEELLEMMNNDKVIPVLLAAANGHKQLTTYLYSKTPPKVFEQLQNRVLLLSLCITAEIFDVALKLLKRFTNLPEESYQLPVHKLLTRRESFSLPTKISEADSLRESLPDKFSILVALAKMPSAFPSGTRFGFLEQIIYNNLSVDRKFSEDYGISDIASFVRKVTRVDKKPLKTSSEGRFRKILLNLLDIVLSGWHVWSRSKIRLAVSILFQPVKLVFMLIFLPVTILGLLFSRVFYEIIYKIDVENFRHVLMLGVNTFKRVLMFDVEALRHVLRRVFGMSQIYDQKCTHYEVIGILSYFSRSVGKFNGLQLKEASAYEAMLHAAQHGIIEFINAMREAKPDLLSAVDSCNRGIFSYAIQYRKQNVFQLIHCLPGRKEIFRYSIDRFRNNLLHLAAHLGPSSDRHSRSGAALQMQREIQWFKAVEKVMHPKFKEAKNDDGKKPNEIFTENHEELVKEGEKWAKDTATSYIIVGALIITIMFAAAFTVPGGNNQDTGLPIFLHDNVFKIFLVADASSLFSSATSVLIFIGILTSRYAEKDFLKSLPWKLMFGLLLLFLSVCSMIVAFCAAIIDMILKGYNTNKWFVVVVIMLLGSIPIVVLVLSQLRLMKEIIYSTWKNRISTID